MNWYIYWYFTIKYLFLGLLGYGRAGNYIGSLFFYLPFIALIMALIAPLSFVNDNKILIYPQIRNYAPNMIQKRK